MRNKEANIQNMCSKKTDDVKSYYQFSNIFLGKKIYFHQYFLDRVFNFTISFLVISAVVTFSARRKRESYEKVKVIKKEG